MEFPHDPYTFPQSTPHYRGVTHGWQPIETAPKDITEVLVFDANMGVAIAQYECHSAYPYWNYDIFDMNPARCECKPVFWMPLPDEPLPAPPGQ